MNPNPNDSLIEPLTEREKDVLALLVSGKTNREIAEELVLSINTVKWYNREIYGKLGVENREAAAERAIELGLAAAEEEDRRLTYNLPHPATPLLGRERELEELESLLLDDKTRIISLIGPGGMGKTRLALELARKLTRRFKDGVAFVPLAPIQNEESVVPAVAQSLRFTFQGGSQDEKTQLINFLREKELLLVLDNFEHLIGSAPLLAEMIAAALKLKIIVTSREKLNLQIEQLYPLQSLSLRDWENVEQAKQDPAVQLFLEYGRRVRPTFELQPEDLEALHQILQLVDGMPLAIILASTWLELLTPEEIAAELEKNIDFLEAGYQDLPGRQQSMRVVFDTSWNRLNEKEQKVFSGLSVFRGGFTLDAARKVVDATPDILLRLVSRSLLSRDENGRFEIHELLRQFAAEQLSRSQSEESAVRKRHSDYFINLLQIYEPKLKGVTAESILEILRMDIDNVHKGWEWAVSQQKFAQLGQGVFSLAYFYKRRGRYEIGLQIFDRTIKVLRKHINRTNPVGIKTITTQIRLLAYQCDLLQEIGDLNAAVTSGEEAMMLLNRSELQVIDRWQEEVLVLTKLSWVYGKQNRTEEGKIMLERSLSLLNTSKDSWELARIYLQLGGSALSNARIKEALTYHRQSLKLYEELGNRRSIAGVRMIIGYELGFLGQIDEAEKMMRNSIKVYQEIKDDSSAANAACYLSDTMTSHGKFEEAKELAEQGIQIYERLGFTDTLIHTNWCWAMYHLGKYETIIRKIPTLLDITSANNRIMHYGWLKFSAGCANLGLGQIKEAQEQLEKSSTELRKISSKDSLCYTLSSLCCAYISEGKLVEAAAVLLEAANIAKELGIELFLTPVVASAALFLLAKGDTERAIEFYALAELHPFVANSHWYEDIIGRPIAEATAATFPPKTVTAAQERGRGLDLWETAESLLQELSPK